MIAIVVPVHNEEELLESCLDALGVAARDPELKGEAVEIFVVLDDCRDRSRAIAAQYPVIVLAASFRNVGKARALGADAAIERGARWLAFTDADSQVPAHWLSAQLSRNADAVCGVVEVGDWRRFSSEQRLAYESSYQRREGHRHVHGANLGVRARSYRLAGGFCGLALHEDVELVRRLEGTGAEIAWVAEPCVKTDCRLEGRLEGGFACYLRALASSAIDGLLSQSPLSSSRICPRDA